MAGTTHHIDDDGDPFALSLNAALLAERLGNGTSQAPVADVLALYETMFGKAAGAEALTRPIDDLMDEIAACIAVAVAAGTEPQDDES